MQVLDSVVEGALCLSNRRESNELLGMIVRFIATGEEPEPRTDAQRMAWTMVRPVLENSRARAAAGRIGGSRSANDPQGAAASKPRSKRVSKPRSKAASKTRSKTEGKAPSERPSEEEEEEREETLTGFPEKAPAPAFEVPTAEEVEAYFACNCLRGDPGQFLDHYAACGWTMPTGQPVADWRALARNWARRQVGYDAERRSRGGQTSQEAAEQAVWRPLPTVDEEIERLERELAEMGDAT